MMSTAIISVSTAAALTDAGAHVVHHQAGVYRCAATASRDRPRASMPPIDQKFMVTAVAVPRRRVGMKLGDRRG